MSPLTNQKRQILWAANKMQKSAIRQTISIALAAVIAVALFAFPAAASELSQDEIDRKTT